MKSSHLKNDDHLWVCLLTSQYTHRFIWASWGSREHPSPNVSETEVTRCHYLAHRSLPGSFGQSGLVLEASWGTWCSGGSRHSRQPSLHSLPLTSWCWWKTSLNLPSQWANLTSLGQGFKLLRSFCHKTENRKLLIWSLGNWGFCQSQVVLAMATTTVSQAKIPKTLCLQFKLTLTPITT